MHIYAYIYIHIFAYIVHLLIMHTICNMWPCLWLHMVMIISAFCAFMPCMEYMQYVQVWANIFIFGMFCIWFAIECLTKCLVYWEGAGYNSIELSDSMSQCHIQPCNFY